MTRVRSSLVLAMAVVLATSLLAAAAEQGSRSRRGFGFSGRTSSLTGLLSREEVQKELKLTDEQKTKVEALSKKLREEMTEQYAGLRDITDAAKRRAKYEELRQQRDTKAREALGDVISREQLMRLYQIRLQISGTVYALNNRYVARLLKLTDEQKKKAAGIDTETQKKQREASSGMGRDASQEQRTKAFAKVREIRQAAEKEALALLTDEQKKGLDKIKGEKSAPRPLPRSARSGRRPRRKP